MLDVIRPRAIQPDEVAIEMARMLSILEPRTLTEAEVERLLEIRAKGVQSLSGVGELPVIKGSRAP